MPIEALAAISLAGNILQFVEVSAKILATSKKIYVSADGMSEDTFNMSTVLNQLQASTERLKDTISPPETTTVWTAADASLEKLRIQCCGVNHELQDVFKSLAVDGRATKWKSFKKALASEWKNGRLQDIQSSLFVLRDEMHFQITVSLRENIDLLAFQQTEAFRQLDATGQTIVNATLNNRNDMLDALYIHTRELQSIQQQALDEAVNAVREDLVDMAAYIGDRVDAYQGHVQYQVDAVTGAIQELESNEHHEMRYAVETQAAAIGHQIEAEHNETRAVILDASNDMRSMVEQVIDQIHTVHERLAQAHLVQHERSREEFRSWVVALMAQQARVIEAQAIAIRAAHESSAGPSSKKVRKALKKAQEALRRALEVLIQLAEMFEKEIGLRYRMVQGLIFHYAGSIDPASFVKQLLNPSQQKDTTELAPPRSPKQGFIEYSAAPPRPSIVLTDAADPEIEAAFLNFFDCQLGRSSRRHSERIELAITSGSWDMAFMSISWSIASTGPFWGLNRGYLQGLSLQEWNKFKNQKWIFIHHDRQLHILEVTNASTDSFLGQIPLRPEDFLKLVQFRWELIAGEDRLVAFDTWESPLTSHPPKEEYMKSLRPPYSVHNKDYVSSVIRAGICAGHVRAHESRIIENTPVFTTEYGQPIRHALSQVVWGLTASYWVDRNASHEDQFGGTKVRLHWEAETGRNYTLMEPKVT